MKKILFLLVVILLPFASCQAQPDPKEQFALPLKITAALDGSDSPFDAVITEAVSEISFGSGHILAGTRLNFSEEKHTASVDGIFTREVKKGTFPAQEALVKAVKLLAQSDEKAIYSDGEAKYTIDEMTIIVYYDKDTEAILGIGTEENGRRFKFSFASFEPYETQSDGAGQS